MSYLELYHVISKPSVSIKEIGLIANCGRDSAIKIRNKIEEGIIKDGKQLHHGKTIVVPTKKVIEYLGLDLDYIINMANIEVNLINGRTSNYAGISR